MLISTVTQKGQATIPLPIRQNLGLIAGSSIQFIEEGATVRLQVLKPLSMYYGIIKNERKLLTPDQLEDLYSQEATDRYKNQK